MAVLEAPPILKHKNVPVVGIKVVDETQGIVEAYVSGIGNKDSSGDIIQPGAFEDSLRVRTPKGVWSHDWSRWVSKTLDIYQVLPGDPRLPVKMAQHGVGGLYVKMQFNLETQDGREGFSNVKFFDDEAEWSIGYMEVETEYSKDAKANLLHKIDLYEYSPVLFGANTLTSTVSVKVTRVGDVNQITIEGLGNKDLEAQVSKAVADTIANAEAEEKAEDVAGEKAEDAAPEEKVVPGSFEARYGAVVQALSAEYPDAYAFAVATFSDSVVYEVMSWDDESKSGTFQCSYSIGEDGEVTFGEPKAVDVVEVVVEKSGGVEALEAKGGSLEKLKEAVSEAQKARIDALIEKAGRVLSTKNQDRLAQAKGLIDEVLSSGDKATEEVSDDAEKAEGSDTDTKDDETDVGEKNVTVNVAADTTGLLDAIKALTEVVAALTPAVKAEETDEIETKKTHAFEKDDEGNCSECGATEEDEVHEKANDEDPDDAGAGSPKKPKKDAEDDTDEKADEVDVDIAALMADLEAEITLTDSFLPAE